MNNQVLFDKFSIISCIKKDEFSAVYLADHIFLGKKIFLKTLDEENLPDPAVLERFKREAKILARLEHPNIIKVLDFGTKKNFFYISFECFESSNLRQLLRQNSLSYEDKDNLTAQICRGLLYVHRKKITHRDLKPENILTDFGLNLKIADFGLAVIKGGSDLTEASSVVGTPAYMSPEQISGKKVQPQSDLFSLGIIIFELYSGRNLFLGDDAGQTLNNILNFNFKDAERQFGSFPAHIREIIHGLLQKDPAKRFSSAADVLNLLPGESIPTAAGPNRKKSVWLKPAFIALILLLFFALFFYPKKAGDRHVLMTNRDSDTVKAVEKPEKKDSLDAGPATIKSAEIKEPVVKAEITASAVTEKKAVSYGNLKIECRPWAHVTIDSVRKETTPLDGPAVLTSGVHSLLFSHPAYPDFSAEVQIDSGRTTLFKFDMNTLMGFLQCKILPWGDVYLNDKYLGQSPFRRPFMVRPGGYNLRVKNEHYKTYSKKIVIKQNDTLQVRINFLTGN